MPVLAGCDLTLSEPVAQEQEILPLVAVGNPDSPIIAMTGTDDVVLWIEGTKDRVTGAAADIDRFVVVGNDHGRELVTEVTLDDRGLPLRMEDSEGTVMEFLSIDEATGTATVRVESPELAPRAPTVVVELGAGSVAEAMSVHQQASAALADHDCAIRVNPFLETISHTLIAANLILCEWGLVVAAATGTALGPVLFTCASALVGLFTLLDSSERLRVANFVVDGLGCVRADPKACADLVWSTTRGLLNSRCSFIGGTWQGSELVIIDGTLRVDTVVTQITEIQQVDGEIDIQQSGCDIEWLIEEAILRTGSVDGNTVTVTGDAGLLVLEDGVVVDAQTNSFVATGEVCGPAVFFDGEGHFSADISGPDGDGSIDVSFTTTVSLRYRPDFFGAAVERSEFNPEVGDVGVAGLVSEAGVGSLGERR